MELKRSDNPNPPPRGAIKPSVALWTIEKERYGTNNYRQGIVKEGLIFLFFSAWQS